jgi:phosphoglycolate phosphatase
MIHYRLVIFDFDGTLADSFPWFASNFNDLADRYRLPRLGLAELEALRRYDAYQLSRVYKISLWKMVVIGEHLKKLMARQIDQVHLVEGMQSVIDALAQHGVMLAVVSSNAEENVRRVLGAENAAKMVVFECGVSLSGKKAKFKQILKKVGLSPNEAISVGDEVRDLKSSRQAKIAFGAVGWGYTHLDTLRMHMPDAIFSRPEEILAAVLG